jgi:hypothetical protein
VDHLLQRLLEDVSKFRTGRFEAQKTSRP